MAKAKVVPPIPPSKTIVLELSEPEAQVLFDILRWHVIGRNRRETCSDIHDALDGIGCLSYGLVTDIKGSVDFV